MGVFPALRDREDRKALWRRLGEGTSMWCRPITVHSGSRGQKTLGRHDFSLIPNGCPRDRGSATGPARGRREGRPIRSHRFVALTAASDPAQLFGLEGRGAIAPGDDADIAIWDMNRERVITAAAATPASTTTCRRG